MPIIHLKKGEDRRIRHGHPWIYSNEVNTTLSPLKSFSPGEIVNVMAHDGSLLGTAYVNPHSLIVGRLFSTTPNQTLDNTFFEARLKKALALRKRLFAEPYYRLVYGEADHLPGVVIDRYHNHLVVQINTAGMEQHQEALLYAILELIPNIESIYLRNDSPIRVMEGLSLYTKVLLGTPPSRAQVQENGISFTFPLTEGQKTGWFYDHRISRARLQSYVSHQQVLDVFSYLGGFGIQAAVYGAKHVDCIEVSKNACDLIHENAVLNHVENRVNTLCIDAFLGMKQLLDQGKRYDVIILDPPAFVKKAKDKKEGTAAYQRINELALKLLNDDGILFSCSCSMHVSEDDLLQIVRRAAYQTNCSLQLVEREHQGPDHPIHPAIPEMNYLKTLIFRKSSGIVA